MTPAKAKPKKSDQDVNYEEVCDKVRDELAVLADGHAGGDVHAINHVARLALDSFDAQRYVAAFQLILELTYKAGADS